jgi:phytoene dehydrogenase-like protein
VPAPAASLGAVPDYDAVVVGSGPNGLAAAVTLTAAGLRVLVVEGAATAGGGCRTEQLTLAGYLHDSCSAVHPLALASPFFRRFGLAAQGVRFCHSPVEFAHPLDGGRAGVVTRSVADTAGRLGGDAPGYRRLFGLPPGQADAIVAAVLSGLRRLPPGLAREPVAVSRFGLAGMTSASFLASRFRTPEARALLAGLAAHAALPLSRPPTGGLAVFLGLLAHAVGWPVVAGGSERITDAMVRYVRGGGGDLVTGTWVRSLRELPPARVTLLDVTPRALVSIAAGELPAGYRRAMLRFRYGNGVFKADYALAGPVPWASQGCRQAGTLHLGGSFEEIARAEAEVSAGRHPSSPYVLVAQPCVADPSRAPDGRQALWAYCHVPAGSDVDMSAAVEAQIERFAPGFRDLVLARSVRTAASLQAHNPNYVGGDIGAGPMTARQAFLRPAARWNPYRTPLRGVYLCSSSTPPGPGVHGCCGELAALTALHDEFGVRRPRWSEGQAWDFGSLRRTADTSPTA